MIAKRTERIEALDIFRALTMYLMLFVNDIPGLKNIPHWLLHASYGEDMLGFSDTIFPGFLFAMGMAIPFAINNRIRKGENLPQLCSHIFWRTIALLVMGVYTVNLETIDPVATGISQPIFSLLMVAGFFLIWNVYPKATDNTKYLIFWLKTIGVCILLALMYVYRGNNGAILSPQWWGILGLIGWTYLVCSLVFLITRSNVILATITMIIFMACSVLSEYGLFRTWPIMNYIPSEVTLHAFGITGMWTGIMMQKFAGRYRSRPFIIIMMVMGVIMLAAAIISHKYWIISKLQATPTWLFYCCAIFFPFFAFTYWLTDIKGKSGWFAIIKPAGTVTLTCYIIPYAWYAIQSILGARYPDALQSGIPGLLKSAVFALAIIGIAWLLLKIRIRLKI